MQTEKTSLAANGLLWFGAAVSIAEILTGTLLAPLGFCKGMLAILLGHAIGCALLFGAGLIGAKTGQSAMETVKGAFGQHGSLLFACLNVLQLVGWTAVMILSGASAAHAVAATIPAWLWCLLIGGLILVWILMGIKQIGKLSGIAAVTLFLLTILLSTIVFRGEQTPLLEDGIRFGAAVELSVAMPLSWLPLISDYTRSAKQPTAATAISAVTYFVASSWMYAIGMGAAMFTGESDIGRILQKAGLGFAALLIVILSTVTTTFLDAYSAGVSSTSITKKLPEKPAAIAVTCLGTLLAIIAPVSDFEDFLYLIGSVFAPMIAIQLVCFFLLRKDSSAKAFDWMNLPVWLAGFLLYRMLMRVDTPVGNTLPDMLLTGALCFTVHLIKKGIDTHAKRNA